jgi:Zn finger protein HypA/HybF involved in hydrogenase expression
MLADPNQDTKDELVLAAWRDEEFEADEKPATKKCPDCAERSSPMPRSASTVGIASPLAHRMPHRSRLPLPRSPQKVMCHKCHHVQTVPQDLSFQMFVCDECGARLKRRTAQA